MRVQEYTGFLDVNESYKKTKSTPGSEGMLGFSSVYEDVAKNTDCVSVDLPSETGQKLVTFDSGVKTIALLALDTKKASASMVRVASAKDFLEACSMDQIFNSGVNLPGWIGGNCGVGPVANSVMPFADESGVYDDRAMFTLEGEESTPDNPIMYVTSKDRENGNFAWYKITINQVDPANATREEMLALITYMYKDDPDPNAFFNASDSFSYIDQYGAGYGLFSKDQVRFDYTVAFQVLADGVSNILGTSSNDPIDITQESYEALLKMIGRMTERSEWVKKRLELEKYAEAEIDKDKDLTDQSRQAEVV